MGAGRGASRARGCGFTQLRSWSLKQDPEKVCVPRGEELDTAHAAVGEATQSGVKRPGPRPCLVIHVEAGP